MARNPGGAEEFPQLPALPTDGFEGDAKKAIDEFNSLAEKYYQKLNGRISLGTAESIQESNHVWAGHLDGEYVRFEVPASNADFAVPHNLERVPVGFLVVDMTSASPLVRLDSTPAHTTRFLWVRTAAAPGTRFTVFVF